MWIKIGNTLIRFRLKNLIRSSYKTKMKLVQCEQICLILT